MEKVGIYARVSTAEGKQNYERQINDLTTLILKLGYKNEQIEIFAEKLSGYQKDRPELTKLLKEIESNPSSYKSIFVTEISRIGRNPRHTREIVDQLTDWNVPLHIQSIGQSTIDSSGKRNVIVSIILQVLMEFSHLEAEQTKSRMASGKLKRVVDGKTSSSNLPYGYSCDQNGYLIIDEDEAQIIRQIFETYKSGIGTLVIANTLNQMKVPTKLNKTKPDKIIKFNKETSVSTGDALKWSDVVIGQILKNTIYKGDRKYKGEKIIDGDSSYSGEVIVRGTGDKREKFKALLIESPELAIVSNDLFDECNELLKSKSTRNYLTAYEYLLKDLIRCGVCGRKYLGKYVNKPSGDKVYKCTSYLKSGEGCGNRSINMSLIESVIYDQILKSEELLKILDNPNDIIKTIKVELNQQEQLLKNEEKFLLEKQKQIENLLRTTTLSANPNFELYAKIESEIQSEIEASKSKIRLITKDIFSKKATIQNFDIEATSKELIANAKHNRPELTNIYKQFIKQININDLGNGYVLANVSIIIKGVELTQKLKLFIFANGVRKYGGRNEKIYKYLSLTKLTNEPVYKDNILLVEVEEIKQEFDHLVDMMNDTTGLIKVNHFTNIDIANRLYINQFDL